MLISHRPVPIITLSTASATELEPPVTSLPILEIYCLEDLRRNIRSLRAGPPAEGHQPTALHQQQWAAADLAVSSATQLKITTLELQFFQETYQGYLPL